MYNTQVNIIKCSVYKYDSEIIKYISVITLGLKSLK